MKTVCVNKRARFKYDILERFEAGLVLKGTEVKSIREGKTSIAESYGRIKGDEAWIHGLDIPPYSAGNIHNHDSKRPRKLLLHRREIHKLITSVSQKGFTLVPLSLYFKRGYAKIDLALAKGKTLYDKRDKIKKQDAKREMGRIRRQRRG